MNVMGEGVARSVEGAIMIFFFCIVFFCSYDLVMLFEALESLVPDNVK